MNFRIFYFLIISMLWGEMLFGNNNYRVIRGERPPVDFNLLEENDYHHGILLIKVREDYSRHLEENPVFTDRDGNIRFGLEQLDKLNEQFAVRSVTQYFATGAFRNGFTARHKAWGFHLWYRLELDEKAHIPSVIQQYQRLREIEIAEPELVKVLIGSGDIDDYHLVAGEILENRNSWTPDDPQYDNQWHYHNTGQQNGTPGADISLPAAWAIEKGDSTVIVAIIDGGIDYSHVDLAGNMWSGIGFNFVNNSPNIEPHNHGTHVAGTIAAVNNNAIGVAGVAGGSGENDGVRLMSCQVFAANTNGGFHIAPVYAADNGASISQNSWGYTSPNFFEQSVLDAIDYFNINGGGDAMDGGITIFAAGNSNSSAAYYPGFYSGAVSVAATNNNDAKSWYSNFGTWVDISAPGGETNTVTQRGVLSTLNNNQYGYYQGTSMACPHVSGVVALILSSIYGEFSPEDIYDIITNTADNHYGANPGFIGQLGAGRINAHHALILAQSYLLLPGNPSGFSAAALSDSEISLNWNLNEENDNIVLAWSANGVFGIPEEGTTYQAGDIIDGGGVVLFAGNAQEFEHAGLNAATLYYYRVWSVNEDTLYSMGRGAQVYTQCGVSTLPVFESFNSSEVPYCWSFPNGQGNWRMISSRGNPAPAIEFYWSPSVTNYQFSLESPPMDGNIPGDAIALEFDLTLSNYNNSSVEEFHVEVYNGTNWVTVLSFDNTQGNIEWDTWFVDITAYALNKTFMVRFTAEGANSFSINQWVIDNFSVYSFSCPQPVELEANSLTTESAVINWLPVGNEQLWDVVWGSPGFDPETSGNLIEGLTVSEYQIDGLSIFTSYQVYVKADCGEGDESLWAGPLNFTTLATCPAPENFLVTEVESTSANLSWEPVGQENSWQVLWGIAGFNPSTEGNLEDNLTDNQFQITGLQNVTQYHAYVRAWCDADDLSLWLGPVEFTTPCDIFALPFAEDFGAGSVSCWTFPEGQGNWGYGSSYPPPSSVSGSPHATFNWSPSRQNYSFSLTSPLLIANNMAGTVFMDFILFINSYNSNNLEELSVEYKLQHVTEWTLLENYTNEGLGSSNQEFIVQGLQLPGAQGQLFQIRFRANGANSFSINGWSVDDIEIYQELTQCYEPVNLTISEITDNTAKFSWTPQGTENAWNVIYGPEGFDLLDEGTLLNNLTETTVVVEGLIQSTKYEFYVKAVCDDADQSEWAGPGKFETEISTYTVLVTFEGEGTVNPEGEIVAQHGSDHSIVFQPDHGYHIHGVWLDESSVMDDLNMDDVEISPAGVLNLLNITDHHHIHAEFQVNVYEINLTNEPIEGGEVDGSGIIPHGWNITVTAVPAENFVFLYWKEEGQQVYDAPTYTFDVDRPRDLVAVFQDVTSVGNVALLGSEVNIYPNPAHDRLWVEFYHASKRQSKVSILTIDGRKVSELLVEDAGQVRLAFDLSDIQPGVYMLRIEGDPVLRKVVIH